MKSDIVELIFWIQMKIESGEINTLQFIHLDPNEIIEMFSAETDFKVDDDVKFSGKLDSVYGIIKKFTGDCLIDADFDQPGADPYLTLKQWWIKNKYKFK